MTGKGANLGASLSYKGRITLLFGLVSVMTALIAALVLAFVWESHFSEYAMQNMENTASTTAANLAESYEENSGWTGDEHVMANFYGSGIVGVQAYDSNGMLIAQNSDAAKLDESRASGQTDRGLSVSAPIVVGEKTVGQVTVWSIGGGDAALTPSDLEFKGNTYGAMVLAAIIAVSISCAIGYVVASGVVDPIRRITKTASQIKGGNLAARTNLVGTDEVAQLGMTFDDMAQSIENDRELERRLTNDVAHELRTPLMAMQATMEAMADGVLPADQQRLGMLDNEVIRLGKLVDALLKLSRLENRSTPMKAREIDLGEELEELVLNHQMLLEESGLAFEYSYEPGVIVMADPDLLKQATANIVSNAVRYTPEGGTISMEVRRRNVMAQIVVSDTGIGMSQEDLRHIFSRFWRADAGRDRASGGLGVGLAIVKEIVDRHKGWVHVDSQEGKGSTFTINIPLVKEDSKKQQRKKQDKQGVLQMRLTKRFVRPSSAPGDQDAGNGDDREAGGKARSWWGRDKAPRDGEQAEAALEDRGGEQDEKGES